ncbi:hypothetical protein P152DRAFT_374107, partial [Eremomyces bilateralis CBS 781.70]
KKEPFTHFLCVPLITESSRPQLVKSLNLFREQTQRSWWTQIPSEAIRPVDTLHLTLGMMTLKDDEQISEAKNFLDGFPIGHLWSDLFGSAERSASEAEANSPPNSGGDPPLVVSLRGLHAMQKPNATTVLYAAPYDPADRLYRYCQAIQKKMMEAGRIANENRPLKLHATVVNTIYARNGGRAGGKVASQDRSTGGPMASKNEDEEPESSAEVDGKPLVNTQKDSGTPKSRHNRPIQLDATGWIERYKDHVWVEDISLQKLSVYKMGATKV